MPKKITTLEELGEEMRAGFLNVRRELSQVRADLIEHDKRTDLLLHEIADLQKLTLRVERIAQHLRERDHADL